MGVAAGDHSLSMDGLTDSVAGLVARQHRLQPLRPGAASRGERTARRQPDSGDIGRVGGILSMTGLLGWALGGFVFGIVGDYAGRARTLMFSVVLVAVCTALQGFTHSTVTFGICRFLTGVGTGAEVVVGIPLVAEAFARVHRAKVLGIMMTGGGFGSLIGGQLFAFIGPYGWRYVLFAGVLPALILLLLRRGLEEPEHFRAVHARRAAIRAQ